MSLLFTQDWDIIRGTEDQYVEFIAQKFIPEEAKLGLRPVGGFYVEVGVGPEIISIKSVESLGELAKILSTPAHQQLMRELKEHVVNYASKVLEPTGVGQNGPYKIQKGVWKYNLYYDVLPGSRPAYLKYMADVVVPTLRKIDYLELTEVWNVPIGGFSEVVAELTFKDPVDVGRLLDDESFREIVHSLRRDLVRNYKSRLLRTTERFDEPRWFRL
ncbi:MAG: hypothetical protein ACYDA8_22130 [Deferrisomatales bacterium]